jgi:hypothetical protein
MKARTTVVVFGLAWMCAAWAATPPAAVAANESGGASAEPDAGGLGRCPAPLGSLAVAEDLNQLWLSQTGQRHKLQSAAPLLRTLAEQSHCFTYVAPVRPGGTATPPADYTVAPAVHFSEHGTNKLGSMALGMLGTIGSAVANSAKTQDAATHLLVTDNRAAQLLAAIDGTASAHNWDLGPVGTVLGDGKSGLGDYAGTAEGKLLTAAFVDAFNQLVQTVRTAQTASEAAPVGAAAPSLSAASGPASAGATADGRPGPGAAVTAQ